MAGYTSRIFVTFSIPFFGFVLWFLKKKISSRSTVSKAIGVEDSKPLEITQQNFLEIDSMKIENHPVSYENSPNPAMHLREAEIPEPNTNGAEENDVQQNGTKQNGTSKTKKNSKAKIHENSHTCPTDITDCASTNSQDSGCGLANDIASIDLNGASSKDELLNAINTQSVMEIVSVTNSNSPTSINGDSTLPETDLSTQKDSSPPKCDNAQVSIETNSDDKRSLQADVSTDSRVSLMLPVDCINEFRADMLGSPVGVTYCDSLGSSTDSGRGGSEIHFESLPNQENVLNYAFEIPQRYVGLLIGRQGKNVQLIKEETNAEVLVKRHPTNNQNKICLLSGSEEEINAALRKIRSKFPPERFPSVTLSQICFLPFMPCPENLMLRLPEGSSFEVILSATVTAGHFFLQQPTHPTFHSLVGLSYQMTEMYNRDLSAPSLPHMEKGYICTANLTECWYRAEIDQVFYETDECRVKYLDYGGYNVIPRSSLRQINYQFMNVPFQATECYLGLVTPLEGQTEWSTEATAAFEELAQGQILQGFIVAYAENGIPHVQLYRITGANHIDINMELGNRGLVRYLKPDASA